jgi:hypothetical protein
MIGKLIDFVKNLLGSSEKPLVLKEEMIVESSTKKAPAKKAEPKKAAPKKRGRPAKK